MSKCINFLAIFLVLLLSSCSVVTNVQVYNEDGNKVDSFSIRSTSFETSKLDCARSFQGFLSDGTWYTVSYPTTYKICTSRPGKRSMSPRQPKQPHRLYFHVTDENGNPLIVLSHLATKEDPWTCIRKGHCYQDGKVTIKVNDLENRADYVITVYCFGYEPYFISLTDSIFPSVIKMEARQ